MKENSFDKDRANLLDWAKQIVAAEKKYDSSMRGVWIDELVGNYIAELGKDFIAAYEYIMEHQSKTHESYGDFDVTIDKIKITGDVRSYEGYHNTVSGMFINDIFCSNMFVVVKHVTYPIEIPKMIETFYHIRKVQKPIKSVKYKTILAYGDIRDDGYVASFRLPYYDRPIELVDKRGCIAHYAKFKSVMDAILDPVFELTENNKTL